MLKPRMAGLVKKPRGKIEKPQIRMPKSGIPKLGKTGVGRMTQKGL